MGLVGYGSVESDPVITCQLAQLCTPRARATEPGRGQKLAPSVPALALRAPQPRAREKTRGQKRKAGRCAKKVTFIHIHVCPRLACMYPRLVYVSMICLAKSARKDPRPEEKSWPMCKKNALHTYTLLSKICVYVPQDLCVCVHDLCGVHGFGGCIHDVRVCVPIC